MECAHVIKIECEDVLLNREKIPIGWKRKHHHQALCGGFKSVKSWSRILRPSGLVKKGLASERLLTAP